MDAGFARLDKEVLGFDVGMDDFELVEVLDSTRDLAERAVLVEVQSAGGPLNEVEQ